MTAAAAYYNNYKKKRDKSCAENSEQLYMENMYATKLISPGLYTSHQATNIPNIILNNLVDTLNLKAKVPHTIVIIINDHRFWNNTDLLSHQMERILNRLIKEVKRIAEARNLSLPPRAVNWDYPRIFLTKALPLPNHMSKPYPKGFKPNRRRYNRLISRAQDEQGYRAINLSDFNCENTNNLFTTDGSLSHLGYGSLWRSISDAIHKADNQE